MFIGGHTVFPPVIDMQPSSRFVVDLLLCLPHLPAVHHLQWALDGKCQEQNSFVANGG